MVRHPSEAKLGGGQEKPRFLTMIESFQSGFMVSIIPALRHTQDTPMISLETLALVPPLVSRGRGGDCHQLDTRSQKLGTINHKSSTIHH